MKYDFEKRKQVTFFAQQAILLLNSTGNKDWGKTFVDLYMEFLYKFKPKTLSTAHGIEFFENILNYHNSRDWPEKGEYGKNFRDMIENPILNEISL